MVSVNRAPEASMLRLSRYHCFVGELLHSDGVELVTSREMSEQLGVAEETVRRDLSYVEIEGRPGSGYGTVLLYEALESYLGLSESYPFVAVGTPQMLEALTVIFPAAEFGLRPVAYYSVRDEDAGAQVDDIEVRSLADLPSIDPALGASVALVACEPAWVDQVLVLLDAAGIKSVLMLTPTLKTQHPEGVDVSYIRIPCAMKALVASAPRSDKCCAGGQCTAHGA